MRLQPIHNSNVWDSFVVEQDSYSFLHSWAWGEVQKKTEEDILRIGVYEDSNLIAVFLAIVVRAKRGAFLFVPHGPIFKQNADVQKIVEEVSRFLRQEATKRATSFVRVSFLLEDTSKNKTLVSRLGYRGAPIYMHAENSWMLPLEKTEEELLLDMRKTTRNLIRRADKEGVVIESSTDDEHLDSFMGLYNDTVQKHHFTPFARSFLRTEIDEFKKRGGVSDAKLYTARWNDTVLSSAIIIYYGNNAYYHHGANSSHHTKIPSSYALQWRAIQDAKHAGKTMYNFWGITKSTNPHHPWAGLTKFKKGFGGIGKDYLHAQDIRVSHKYWIPYTIDTIRRMRRHQ